MQDSGKVKKSSFCWKRTKTTQEYSCSCRACKHLWDTVSIRIWTLCTESKHGLCGCWSQQVLTANTKACRNLFWRPWFREAKCRVTGEQQKKVMMEQKCLFGNSGLVRVQHSWGDNRAETYWHEITIRGSHGRATAAAFVRCERVLFRFLQANKK